MPLLVCLYLVVFLYKFHCAFKGFFLFPWNHAYLVLKSVAFPFVFYSPFYSYVPFQNKTLNNWYCEILRAEILPSYLEYRSGL